MRRKRQKTASSEAPSGEQSRAKLLFPGDHGGSVQSWKLAPKATFEAGDVLAKCLCLIAGDKMRVPCLDLIAPFDGTLLEILAPAGQEIPASDDANNVESQAIARISYCKHDIILPEFGLCGICGRTPSQLSSVIAQSGSAAQMTAEDGGSSPSSPAMFVDPNKALSANMTLNLAGGTKIVVSQAEAHDERKDTVRRLLGSKKLLLVLDIDHTMLHAVDDNRAPEFSRSKRMESALHSFHLPPHEDYPDLENKPHYCVLRPGLATWLDVLSKKYELYIYTAGTRVYAEAVAKIFDPTGKLFGSRIISRTDVPELGKIKRLERFFPVDNNMVLAVDDRSDVWASDTSNLITIRPYHFFKGMSDINNASGPEFDLKGEEEAEAQDERHRKMMDHGLKRVCDVLSWVHNKFYADKTLSVEDQLEGRGGDVKRLVKKLRSRIFRDGLNIVVDAPVFTAEREELVAMAESCGGCITETIEKNTQVVISSNANSVLAQQGKDKQIWVVHPDWLKASIHNWNKESFVTYTMFGLSKSRIGDASKSLSAAASSSNAKKGPSIIPVKTEPKGDSKRATKAKQVKYDEFGYEISDDESDSDDEEETNLAVGRLLQGIQAQQKYRR